MNLKELNEAYKRAAEIQQLRDIADSMSRTASSKLFADQYGSLDEELADVREEIQRLEEEATASHAAEFVDSIPDQVTRHICHLRFIKGMPWKAVGQTVNIPVNTCKDRVYKYLRQNT